MKKLITILLVLSLVLLVACQTQEKVQEKEPVKKAEPAKEPEPTKEPVVETVKKLPLVGQDIEKICGLFMPAERFSEICELDAEKIVTNVKESEKTCWVTFTDKTEKKYTAGFTMVDWLTAAEAESEFKRGINMRRLEPATDVGTQDYKYQEIDRENIVWQHGRFLTKIGASTNLCTQAQLLKVAQEVDGQLG